MLIAFLALGTLLATCGAAGAIQLAVWLRRVKANHSGLAEDVNPDRYIPMLRLLAGYEDEPLAGPMGAENRARIRAWSDPAGMGGAVGQGERRERPLPGGGGDVVVNAHAKARRVRRDAKEESGRGHAGS